MASWNTYESSSDSDDESASTNTPHSSYDYWQQYYQKRKQNNLKQRMNSKQRSYHKYQRNFISSKTGNVSSYHHHKTEQLNMEQATIKKENDSMNDKQHRFNTHIVSTQIDKSIKSKKQKVEEIENENTISPFLRVQQQQSSKSLEIILAH